MTLTAEQIRQACLDIVLPSGEPMPDDALERVLVDADGAATVALRGATLGADELAAREAIRLCLLGLGVPAVRTVRASEGTSRSAGAEDPVPSVRHVVLVMSGKGGVGKSTVAVNLALALRRLGYRTGLLDADIYGPSLPTMMGVAGPPKTAEGRIVPLSRFGLSLMSMGFLLQDPTTAVVWRGPLVHRALLQLLGDVTWGELDFLILDLPPGTGDVTLTLSQRLATSGAIVVTTPEEVALQDVFKSVSMAKKVSIPVLGVVENQSYFVCDGCSKRHTLFGSGGGARVAEFADAPLLAELPLDPRVGTWADAGTPIVQALPTAPVSAAFLDLARRLADEVDKRQVSVDDTLQIDRTGGVNRHLPIAR